MDEIVTTAENIKNIIETILSPLSSPNARKKAVEVR